MPEHDALDFSGSNCSITFAAAVFERCPCRDWIRCFTGHGRCVIVLQKFFVVIRLDHERVHLSQPLDHHLGRVTEIGDEPEAAEPA